MEPIGFAAILVSLVFLAWGSWEDYKTREVPNKVWAFYAPIAIALTAVKLFFFPELLILTLISISIVSGLSIALFYVGFTGGADAKAFICISVAVPVAVALPVVKPLLGFMHPFFPISVMYNSFLLSLSVVAYTLLRNVLYRLRTGGTLFEGFKDLSSLKKATVLITSYKVSLSELERNIGLYPAEEVVEKDGKPARQLKLVVGVEEDREKLIERLKSQLGGYADGAAQVWATPGMPMLLFITAGLVLTLLLGDIPFWIISHLVAP